MAIETLGPIQISFLGGVANENSSLNWREMDSTGGLLDKELVAHSHPEGCGQWPRVPKDVSDKWCPLGVRIGTTTVQYLH